MDALPVSEGGSEAAPTSKPETFVSIADPSPIPNLNVDSALYCGDWNRRRGFTANWALVTSYPVGSLDGVVVSGVARLFTRTATGEYSQVGESPFGIFMLPNETRDSSGYVESRDIAAAKLEVEWQASRGSRVDPAASVQHGVRTTACVR